MLTGRWLPGTRQRQALASRQVPGTTGHTRSQCSASVCPLLTPDIANQISSAGCWWGLDWLWWLLPDCARPGHESQVRCAALLSTANRQQSGVCTLHCTWAGVDAINISTCWISLLAYLQCRVPGPGLGAVKNARGEKTWENGYQTIHTYLVLDIYTYLVLDNYTYLVCLVLPTHSVTPHNGYRTIIVAVVTIVTLLITLAFNVQYSRYLDEHEHFCGYEW